MGASLGPYLPRLIPSLIQNLAGEEVQADVKTHTLEALGDIASFNRAETVAHLGEIMPIVNGALITSAKVVDAEEDPDLFECLQSLREALLIFYTGLLHGLESDARLILPSIPKVIEYCLMIVQD